MRYLKTKTFISSPFLNTLVYANVFIALCAFSQVLLTYHFFPIPVNFDNNSYLLFVMLATYLQYNVQRGYYIVNHSNSNSPRSQWVLRHKKVMGYTIGVSLIVLLFLCNKLSWLSIGIMVGAEIISTLYYLQPFNLRRHGYIKPFLISTVWVISCGLVPLIENQLLTIHSAWFLASQFVFISVLCLLFDIKDNDKDYLSGVNTYANRFGVSATKLICAVMVLIGFTCFYMFKSDTASLTASVILRILLLFTILYTSDKRHAFYYYLWVDGLLIIQTILFFIF
ncbi:MAG: UbiA family prenyltransferase [Burkholderiales bacterium]|nr:UbiA family prenyltransferase [Bacteroidia bacterium]